MTWYCRLRPCAFDGREAVVFLTAAATSLPLKPPWPSTTTLNSALGFACAACCSAASTYAPDEPLPAGAFPPAAATDEAASARAATSRHTKPLPLLPQRALDRSPPALLSVFRFISSLQS